MHGVFYSLLSLFVKTISAIYGRSIFVYTVIFHESLITLDSDLVFWNFVDNLVFDVH